MKVRYFKNDNNVTFGDLNIGDVFEKYECIFIKVSRDENKNAFKLNGEGGRYASLDDVDEVEKLKAELIIMED